MYTAHVIADGKEWVQVFSTAEGAAGNLEILMYAEGWAMDRRSTIARLKSGERLRLDKSEYWITRDSD